MVTSLLVAEINNIIHRNSRHFVKWPPQTSTWLIPSTDTYDTILFLQVYAKQNLDIESKLKALRLLLSEIDVLLWKWPPCFLNGFQNGGCNGMMYSAILSMKSMPHKT